MINQTNDDFYRLLSEKHRMTLEVPSARLTGEWAWGLLEVLFPEVSEKRLHSLGEVKNALDGLKAGLKNLLFNTRHFDHCNTDKVADHFFDALPHLYQALHRDALAFVDGDPAADSYFEVIRSYPGFYAIYIYRIAHMLHSEGVPLLPRILSELAHSRTGIDIHPAAVIGDSFFIDHGTGVVIGETTIIGDHVKIYQGVTLGALSIDKKMAGIKRHPSVGDNVVIYSGATILGGDTVIGEGSVIGGNVWLTKSVPPGTKVYHNADNRYIESLTLNS